MVISSPSSDDAVLDAFLATTYQLFADYVLKNPFYDLEQPIHGCEKFQTHLEQAISAFANSVQ